MTIISPSPSGREPIRTFLLFNRYWQSTEIYKDQHAVLSSLYKYLYIDGEEDAYDLIIRYPEMAQKFLVPKDKFLKWAKQMRDIELSVRLNGSDIIGLQEYLEFQDYSVEFTTNPHVYIESGIDYTKYVCFVGKEDWRIRNVGATRHEALALAFLEIKKRERQETFHPK